MDLENKALLAVVFSLMLIALPASAFTLNSDTDSATLNCADGSAFLWITNDASESALYSLSIYNPLNLTSWFDSSSLQVPGGETRGAAVHFSAPGCFQGQQNLVVEADKCAGTQCEKKWRKISVFVPQACSKNCASRINAVPPQNSFSPGQCTTDSCFSGRQSDLSFNSFFSNSVHTVDINGAPSECLKLNVGESRDIKLRIQNTGAAGTFDFKITGDTDSLNPSTDKGYVSLPRGGFQDVVMEVSPGSSTQGNSVITFNVMNSGDAIASESVCVNVFDSHSASLSLPGTIQAFDCENPVITGKIRNEGSAADSFIVTATPEVIAQGADSFSSIAPDPVAVGGKSSAEFKLTLNTKALSLGPNKIIVQAKGEQYLDIHGNYNKAQGMGEVTVNVNPCQQVQQGGSVTVNITQTTENGWIGYGVYVTNNYNKQLDDVSVSVQGIPQEWKVITTDGVSIPPGEARRLTLLVKPTTQDDAMPVILVNSKGSKIASQPVGKTSGKNAGGLSGLFVLGADNWILLLIALAAIIALGFFATRPTSKQLSPAAPGKVEPQADVDAYKKLLSKAKDNAQQ